MNCGCFFLVFLFLLNCAAGNNLPLKGMIVKTVDVATKLTCYCNPEGNPITTIPGLEQSASCSSVCSDGESAYEAVLPVPKSWFAQNVTLSITGPCILYDEASPLNLTYSEHIYTITIYCLAVVDLPPTATATNYATLKSCKSTDGLPNPFYLVLPSVLFICSDYNIGFQDAFTSFQECMCVLFPKPSEYIPPGFSAESNCSKVCSACVPAMQSCEKNNQNLNSTILVTLPDFGPCINFYTGASDSLPDRPYEIHAASFQLGGDQLPAGVTEANWDDLVNCTSLATKPRPSLTTTKSS